MFIIRVLKPCQSAEDAEHLLTFSKVGVKAFGTHQDKGSRICPGNCLNNTVKYIVSQIISVLITHSLLLIYPWTEIHCGTHFTVFGGTQGGQPQKEAGPRVL